MRPDPHRLLLAPLVLLFASGAARAEEQFYYVDPVLGVDAPGGGHAFAPWRTITYGLAQPKYVLARFILAPGVYSEAGGESFPLELPPYTSLVGQFPTGARFEVPTSLAMPPAAAVFRCRVGSGEGGWNYFWDFEVAADHTVFEFESDSFSSGTFDLRGLSVTSPRGIRFSAEEASDARLSVSDSRFSNPRGCIEASVRAPALWTVSHVSSSRSILATGTEHPAVVLRSSGAAAHLVASASASVVRSSGSGFVLATDSGGDLEAHAVHCLFWDNGAPAPLPSFASGAIVEAVAGAGPRPVVHVTNSIFRKNLLAAELPHYDPARYFLEHSMFEDPLLAALPTSVPGDPVFVQPESDDFHILAPSANRDAGTTLDGFGYADLDGDPLSPQAGGDGLPDLGPDEYFERYLYFHPRLALGQTSSLRVLGPAGDLAFVHMGPPSYWPGFGSGLQLTSLYFPQPLATGLLPPSGLLRFPLHVAGSPGLIGFPHMVQAVYVSPPTAEVTFSVNAPKGWLTD